MDRPLHGKRILVTRPAAQAGRLAGLIVDQGGEAILFPLLDIGPADDPALLHEAIARLEGYAIAVFISPNAVDYSMPAILAQRPWPDGLQAAAIGQSTVAQLALSGIGNVVAPVERFDSEALLELPAFQAQRVAGKRVLILRGNGGRELLAETLLERGAQVDCVSCYRRSMPSDGASVVALLHGGRLDALTISSSEGLRNLMTLLDPDAITTLCSVPVFVPHQRIAEVAAGLGLRQIVLTPPADAGIIEGLCAYNWPHHE